MRNVFTLVLLLWSAVGLRADWAEDRFQSIQITIKNRSGLDYNSSHPAYPVKLLKYLNDANPQLIGVPGIDNGADYVYQHWTGGLPGTTNVYKHYIRTNCTSVSDGVTVAGPWLSKHYGGYFAYEWIMGPATNCSPRSYYMLVRNNDLVAHTYCAFSNGISTLCITVSPGQLGQLLVTDNTCSGAQWDLRRRETFVTENGVVETNVPLIPPFGSPEYVDPPLTNSYTNLPPVVITNAGGETPITFTNGGNGTDLARDTTLQRGFQALHTLNQGGFATLASAANVANGYLAEIASKQSNLPLIVQHAEDIRDGVWRMTNDLAMTRVILDTNLNLLNQNLEANTAADASNAVLIADTITTNTGVAVEGITNSVNQSSSNIVNAIVNVSVTLSNLLGAASSTNEFSTNTGPDGVVYTNFSTAGFRTNSGSGVQSKLVEILNTEDFTVPTAVAPQLTVPFSAIGFELQDYTLDFGSGIVATVVTAMRGFLLFLLTALFFWHSWRVVFGLAPK